MKKVMHAAIATIVLTTSSSAFAQAEQVTPTVMPGRVNSLAPSAPVMEKCYGVTKAHMNDCASGANACAGQSGFDGDKSAWIYLPKGSCGKLVNGTVKSPSEAVAPATQNHDTSTTQ